MWIKNIQIFAEEQSDFYCSSFKFTFRGFFLVQDIWRLFSLISAIFSTVSDGDAWLFSMFDIFCVGMWIMNQFLFFEERIMDCDKNLSQA